MFLHSLILLCLLGEAQFIIHHDTMKDLSLYLLKNSFGSKMKKGFRNFCNGETSTSTLNQHKPDMELPRPPSPPARESQLTLEEMILQLEMDEKMSRRGKLDSFQHRMSCVNSSDILRSARNALNQYPRFSLDGKDAMYRSSFTAIRMGKHEFEAEKKRRLPAVVGGERVMWCKPGVVGRLMGLDAMPIPLNSISYRRERLLLRKRAETERRRRRGVVGSCSRTNGYCVVDLEIPSAQTGCPITRFL